MARGITAIDIIEVVDSREPWQWIDFMFQVSEHIECTYICRAAAASESQCIIDNLDKFVMETIFLHETTPSNI